MFDFRFCLKGHLLHKKLCKSIIVFQTKLSTCMYTYLKYHLFMSHQRLHMLHVGNKGKKPVFTNMLRKSIKFTLKCHIWCLFLWYMKQKGRLGIKTSYSSNQNVMKIEAKDLGKERQLKKGA